jgi:membrane protein YdbS with pleckstrin-like domain
MLPSFLVCGLLTLAIMAWAFGMLPSHLARYVVYGLVGAVWLVQLARWGYRVAAINYRLTTHRLVADRGFFSPTVRQIELARVATVRVDAGPWERWVGVGRVQVVPENGQQAPVVLEGVREPERLAVLIEGCVKRAREHHVVGLHS